MKKKIVHAILLACGLVCSFMSCSNDELSNIGQLSSEQTPTAINGDELKQKFSIALSNFLSENVEARGIIKEEALKRIDFDTDVIYLLIKDRLMESGMTFEESLTKYMDREYLDLLVRLYPTITIFVPTLPLDSFSADSWDIESEIPSITFVSTQKDNLELPVFHAGELSDSIHENEIPILPMLVVKENERLTKSSSIGTRSHTRSVNNSSVPLEFISEVFNNQDQMMTRASRPSYGGGSSKPTRPTNADGSVVEDPKPITPTVLKNKTISDYKDILNAYDEFGVDGWQRDHIYYGMTKEKDKGTFDRRWSEYLISFEMRGDGKTSLYKIADQPDDPRPVDHKIPAGRHRGGTPTWTDGELEFKLSIYIGAKTPVGNVFETFFRISPDDLFELNINIDRKGRVTVKNAHIKKYYFPEPLQLFTWDLEKYSANTKLVIEEVDVSTTITETNTHSYEYATNFSVEASSDSLLGPVKVGAKYGVTTKDTRTSSFSITKKLDNDMLGEIFFDFEDPIIVSKENKNIYRDDIFLPNYIPKYQTGWCKIEIEPRKMY